MYLHLPFAPTVARLRDLLRPKYVYRNPLNLCHDRDNGTTTRVDLSAGPTTIPLQLNDHLATRLRRPFAEKISRRRQRIPRPSSAAAAPGFALGGESTIREESRGGSR